MSPSPRPMRITVTPVGDLFLVRKECQAGHHYASVLYTAGELDELGERIREARGGDKAGGGR